MCCYVVVVCVGYVVCVVVCVLEEVVGGGVCIRMRLNCALFSSDWLCVCSCVCFDGSVVCVWVYIYIVSCFYGW